ASHSARSAPAARVAGRGPAESAGPLRRRRGFPPRRSRSSAGCHAAPGARSRAARSSAASPAIRRRTRAPSGVFAQLPAEELVEVHHAVLHRALVRAVLLAPVLDQRLAALG